MSISFELDIHKTNQFIHKLHKQFFHHLSKEGHVLVPFLFQMPASEDVTMGQDVRIEHVVTGSWLHAPIGKAPISSFSRENGS